MSWEFSILYWIRSLSSPWLDSFMLGLTKLVGKNAEIWLLIGILLLCFKRTRRTGIAVILAFLTAFLFGNLLLKNLAARPRPCMIDKTVELLIPAPGSYSFPSGHTLLAFAGATALFLREKRAGTAALLLAALIGFSRLYLFVHFPTDVLGGMVLGILFGILANWLVSWRDRGGESDTI